jgi:FtsP/CotA-like multicopper oxidase with cupredoxin domain
MWMPMSPLLLTRRALIAGTALLLAARPLRAQTPVLVLRAAEADIPLGPDTLGAPAFNGLPVGPAIEIPRGMPFALKIENKLDVEFYFRPQGLRGRAVRGNDTPIKPGEVRDLVITPPDAGTFVYRAGCEDGLHMNRTLLLSGPLIVTQDAPRVADRDVVMAVNTLILPEENENAPPRRVVTVNGLPNYALKARPGERLRLRLINLAQEAPGGLKMPADTQVVALDGQPSEPFPPFDGTMVLAPLGRADILLEVPRDKTAMVEIMDAFDPLQVVSTITVEGEPMTDRFLARELPNNTGLPKEIPLQSAKRVTWKPLESASDPLASVKAGTSVVLTFENNDTLHALMLDGQTARLLDTLDDGWKPWWHDTLLVNPGETARLAFLPKEKGRYALDMIPLEGNGAPTRAWIEVS